MREPGQGIVSDEDSMEGWEVDCVEEVIDSSPEHNRRRSEIPKVGISLSPEEEKEMDEDYDDDRMLRSAKVVKTSEYKKSITLKANKEDKSPEKKKKKYDTFFQETAPEEDINDYLREIGDSDETVLVANKDLKVTVADSKFNSGGFFSFSYIDFEILTEPFDWEVRRKEIDFVKMREYYLSQFPQYVIPPLITSNNKMGDGPKIEQSTFQQFLDSLLKHEEFRATEYLVTFLKESSQKKYTKFRNQMEKLPPPTELSDFRNIDGQVGISIPSNHMLFVKE